MRVSVFIKVSILSVHVCAQMVNKSFVKGESVNACVNYESQRRCGGFIAD